MRHPLLSSASQPHQDHYRQFVEDDDGAQRKDEPADVRCRQSREGAAEATNSAHKSTGNADQYNKLLLGGNFTQLVFTIPWNSLVVKQSFAKLVRERELTC